MFSFLSSENHASDFFFQKNKLERKIDTLLLKNVIQCFFSFNCSGICTPFSSINFDIFFTKVENDYNFWIMFISAKVAKKMSPSGENSDPTIIGGDFTPATISSFSQKRTLPMPPKEPRKYLTSFKFDNLCNYETKLQAQNSRVTEHFKFSLKCNWLKNS